MPESDEKRPSTGAGSGDAPESGGGQGDDEELSLEERLDRLDEIVSTLEADDVGLDRALALFEEGVGHVRAAEKALSEAELRVEELLGEGEEAETRPLDRDPE